jgi:hypothetical protein
METSLSKLESGTEFFAAETGPRNGLTREFGRHVFEIAALLRVSQRLYNYSVWVVGVMGIELVTPSLLERKTTTKTFSHHGSRPRDCSA